MWARETGAIRQIGVLTRERCIFGAQTALLADTGSEKGGWKKGGALHGGFGGLQ